MCPLGQDVAEMEFRWLGKQPGWMWLSERVNAVLYGPICTVELSKASGIFQLPAQSKQYHLQLNPLLCQVAEVDLCFLTVREHQVLSSHGVIVFSHTSPTLPPSDL